MINRILTKSQMCQQRDFQIIHGTTISVFRTVFNLFIPSALGIVQFHLNTAQHIEILFGNISAGHTKNHTVLVCLLDARAEIHLTQVQTAIDTNG